MIDAMRMKLRLLASAVLLLLAACAAPPPSASPTLAASAAPITLTVWHTQTGAALAQLTALADDFHKVYPTLTIRLEQKGNASDLLRQGLAGIALNQVPDAVLAEPRTLAEFARKDALAPFDPFLDDSQVGLDAGERADFLGGALAAGKFPDLKNQTWFMLVDARAVVLFYNSDQLQMAKADAPPRTWDQFANAARVTTNGNQHGWAMTPNALALGAQVWSRGGNLVNDAQTQSQVSDDAGTRALQMIAALSRGDAAYLTDAAHARDDFAQGQAALWLGTTDDLTSVSDAIARTGNPFRWGVTNVPQADPAHPVAAIYGTGIALFKTSNERARAAWLFVRWLTLTGQTARWARATATMPLRVSALPFLANNPPAQWQYVRDGFGDTLPVVRALPNVKDGALFDATLNDLWISVANGTDPNTALKSATTRINRIVQTP